MKKSIRHHYVPQWYQYGFLPNNFSEKNFFYLDLDPKKLKSNNHIYKQKKLLRRGPKKCFYKDDLYTTNLGEWSSDEIEKYFFGKIDSSGHDAIEYFSNFKHSNPNHELFKALIIFMSVQKLRTIKGINSLSKILNLNDKNSVLTKIQQLQHTYCALWAECIWSIADAVQSKTKFILSDHPVTVYNKACFPRSKWCKGYNDPDIALTGTHTLFPLNIDKILILTNLSWIRNPYQNPLKRRVNPNPFRNAIFNFMQIQVNRILSELEVREINYIIKSRAYKYIAAAQEEWLYPEKYLSERWDKIGNGYLLMPDPRSIQFSTELLIGSNSGMADAFDEYGRKPWQIGYNDEEQRKKEWNCFCAFQCEFARLFGQKRRGVSNDAGIQDIEDSIETHQDNLRLEPTYKSLCRGKKKS